MIIADYACNKDVVAAADDYDDDDKLKKL